MAYAKRILSCENIKYGQGWYKLAKLCGFYASEHRKVEVSDGGVR